MNQAYNARIQRGASFRLLTKINFQIECQFLIGSWRHLEAEMCTFSKVPNDAQLGCPRRPVSISKFFAIFFYKSNFKNISRFSFNKSTFHQESSVSHIRTSRLLDPWSFTRITVNCYRVDTLIDCKLPKNQIRKK